jgi:hypothetical protein
MPKYGRGGRPISKPRKRRVSSVKKSCDRLWAQVVKARAGGCCERCGETPESKQALHAHHTYGRSDHRLRFDVRNGVALCWSDHRWAEEHPIEFALWFQQHRRGDVNYLAKQRREGILKRNLSDYLELEQQLLAMKEDATKAA